MPPTGPGSSGTASSSSVSPPSGTNSPGAQAPSTTTTATVGPVTGPTTTPAPVQSQPTARSEQAVEYLDPPGTPSITYAFTGAGATEVSVVWSTPIYLTLVVGCPGQSQSVGGTTAMATTLPDAAGPCRATVTEPASESVALAYTITIGPPGA